MATTVPALGALAHRIRGDVVVRGDARYEVARQVKNAVVDVRPSAIVRARGAMDVIAVVDFARETGAELAVRGGAHHVAGFGSSDGGIVLDLSPMRGVWVDAERGTVRVQGGAVWGDVDAETQAYGLATPGATISDVGVGGFTLGGGLGWLGRRHGLAADNLVSADVVTAGGRLVTASATSHPDLFWALRGGGGNFGVVTCFEFRLHEVAPVVSGGAIVHAAADAPAALRRARDLMAVASGDLALTAALVSREGRRLLALAAAWFGEPADADEAVAPLREGNPVADMFGTVPYLALQRASDALVANRAAAGERSEYLRELPDEAIDALVGYAQGAATQRSHVFLTARGGAIAAVGGDETAVSDRTSPWLVSVGASWDDPEAAGPNGVWIERLARVVDDCRTGGTYVNMLASGERKVAAYGERTWSRLELAKAVWDPENLFRVNHNVEPAM